jgi:thiamine biosynthesis lipoprotein
VVKRPVSRRNFIKIAAASGLTLGLSAALVRRLIETGELSRVEETRGAIGTYIRLVLLTLDRSSAQLAIDATFARIAQLELIFSHHRADSALARLNATGQLSSPPGELIEVLRQAGHVHTETNGAFDVTIQPLVQLIEQRTARSDVPTTAELRALLPLVGFSKVKIDSTQIEFQQSGMAITLDGIAKGYIIDAALAELNRHGYPQAMVDAGGDIASSPRDDGQSWHIGLQDPRRSTGDSIAVTKLARGALATSGDYLHAYTPDFGLHHILDPRTGLSPLELSSVSIVAPNACLADALATGVMVLGVEAGMQLIERRPEVEGLLITKHDQVIRSTNFPSET